MIVVYLFVVLALFVITTLAVLSIVACGIARALAAGRTVRPIVLQVEKENDCEPRWSPPYFGPQL